jgi:glycosyltransferase involved in cell wall biosynthesis
MENKRLLVITNKSPLPVKDGAALRVYNLITNLPHFWDIDLICEIPENDEFKEKIIKSFKNVYFFINKDQCYPLKINNFEKIKNLLWPVQNLYSYNINYSKEFDNLIKRTILENSYDAILCFWAVNYGFYLTNLNNINITCDVCDSLSLHIRSLAKAKKVFSREWISLKYAYIYNLRWEKKYLANCKKLVIISERDKAWLSKAIDKNKIYVISNGVDVNYFNPEVIRPGIKKELIVFSGVMDYEPNHDAMIYCLEEIWPKIKKEIPYAMLKIIGRYPRRNLIDLASKRKDVEVTGEVDDIRNAIKGARVFLAPMRIGSGMKNKILEAMAMGIPVVTTSEGAAGIEIENGKNCIITENPDEIAKNVISLLNNDSKWNEISKLGRELVFKKYSWKKKGEKLSEILLEID